MKNNNNNRKQNKTNTERNEQSYGKHNSLIHQTPIVTSTLHEVKSLSIVRACIISYLCM